MSNPAIRPDPAPDRRGRILSRLRTDGFLAVNDVARELEVSHMTVRRDLHALEEAGQVRMVHGGVSLTPESLRTAAFPDDGNAGARQRIAQHAVAMVDPSDTVVIDAGPTGLAVARALPAEFTGTVISHSMPVLQLLDERPGPARAVALGGELLAGRHAFVGPTTEASLEHLRARTFFMSAIAVDALGSYSRSPTEASLQRHLIEIVERVVLVVTRDVFTGSAPIRIAELDRLTAVVTDRPPPPAVAAALRRAAVAIHVVDA